MISKFCYPFFRNTPIAFYDYGRFYDDGKVLAYSTCPDAETSVFKYLPTRAELELFRLSGQRIVYMSHLLDVPDIEIVDQDKYLTNIDRYTQHQVFHRLYFVDRIDQYYRVSGFGVRSESKSAFNYYLNNLQALENFIDRFEIAVNEQLRCDVKNRLVTLADYLAMPNIDMPASLPKLSLSQQSLSSDALAYDHTEKVKIFTTRENECVALLAKGYTMKMAGLSLGISPRTVEMHIRNIKEKHGIYNKQQLIELWHSQTPSSGERK